MKTKYKYFYFELVSAPVSKKQTWFCISSKTKYLLAIVKWFAEWQQYCCFPEEATIFSSSCLTDVADFVNQVNELHNKERG